jgi:L-alanine-DL-glutamate epimerase-like enolase superfamily enzyme
MHIAKAERLTLNIPFYAPRVVRAMQRALTHHERVYVYRLTTTDGTVGYGDALSVHDVDSLVGRNIFSLLNDDSVGLGPQLAAYDAAGKIADVPAHVLLGTQVRQRCPFSWWDIDMPPADWAAEARESIKRGYTSFKMKARPWFDIINQVETVGKVVPADYKFDVDFNGFLLNPAKAEIVLKQLDDHPNVGIYESPFYLYNDLKGAHLLRQQVRKPIVEHFQDQYLAADCSDGFVIGAGAVETRRQAALAASFNKPFWIQQVGTGITAAFVAHLGSVLSHAQLPYITAHELWESDLLTKRLEIVNGLMDVPEGPGLGIEVDENALEKYQVEEDAPTPGHLYNAENRILRISWPGVGKTTRAWEFTAESHYYREFSQGNIPGFERGVNLEVIEDNGSAAFRKRHEELAAKGL